MKDANITTIAIILAIIITGLIACSHSRYNLPIFISEPEHPDGVDSLIITKSDSIIKYLFVDYANEQKASQFALKAKGAFNLADSTWQVLKQQREDTASLSLKEDSARLYLEGLKSDLQIKKVKVQLQLAEKNYQQAVKLNPFDFRHHEGLAETYILWAEIEKPELYYEKAAQILNEVVTNEKGEHYLFSKLADCYFQLQKWSQALQNYRQAEQVLLALTSDPDSTHKIPIMNDSLKASSYFTYLYFQAVCLAKMYDARESLITIKKARAVASESQNKKLAERFEEWLNWDHGNIRAAEEKNQILELIHQGKYAESVVRLERLKSQLSDPLAIDEIEWRIAGLEFKYLNQKEPACRRLLDIIKRNEPKSYYPSQFMSDFNQYVTDCGIMHFNLGMEYLQNSDYKQAQKYLDQGAKINWYGNYKCQLELAKLNKHAPQISLQIIDKVLQSPIELTHAEKLSALELKLSALKKLGPQYINETKQIYRQIRELQNKQ